MLGLKATKKSSKVFVPLRGRSPHLAVGVLTNLTWLGFVTSQRADFSDLHVFAHTLLGRDVTFEQIFWSSSEFFLARLGAAARSPAGLPVKLADGSDGAGRPARTPDSWLQFVRL